MRNKRLLRGIQSALQNPKSRKFLLIGSAFLLYGVFSWLYFGPSTLTQLSHNIFSDGGDSQQFVWLYNWWPYSVTHGLNPFVSQYNWYPSGYPLAWSTSIAGLAFLMAPVTLLGNALLAYNLMALLSPVLAATGCFALVYYVTRKYLPALFAGYIYGFSSFMLGQMLGHAQMYAVFVPPLLLLAFLLVYRQRLRQRWFVLLSALLLALQFTISEEVYATFIGFSMVALTVFYITMPAWRGRLAGTAKLSGVALLGSLVLVSPFLYFMMVGHSDVPKIIHPMSAFSINVANYLVPTQLTLFGGQHAGALSSHFTANLSENGGYIGLPLALILAYIAFRHWKDKVLRSLIILLGIVMIAALGPRLHLIGQVGASIPMPWQLVSWLPLVDSAQPDRLTMYAFLLIAIIIGYWLSLKTERTTLRMRQVAVVIGLAFIVPNTSVYMWSRIDVPSFFNAATISQNLPAGSQVIILPFERQGNSAYYQYASGMYFTQTGAYTGFIPNRHVDPVITMLSDGTPGTNFAPEFIEFCQQHHISHIIFTSSTPAPLTTAISSLDWPSHKTGGVTVVVPPTGRVQTQAISSATRHSTLNSVN